MLRSAMCLLLLGSLASCKDEVPDPLSAAAIDEVSQENGDAKGTDWTGDYETSFDLIDCNCPTLMIEEGGMEFEFEICDVVDFSPEEGATPVKVVQTDGFLLFTLGEAGQMSGPVDSDGAFTVASRVNLDSIVFEHELLGRVDGQFSGDADKASFDAPYQQRLVGDYQLQQIDCRARFDIHGDRIQ